MARISAWALICCLIPVLAGCANTGGPRGGNSPIIAIQPIGHVRDSTVRKVESIVADRMKAKVVLLAAKAMPKQAYYAPRHRWRAPAIAESLAKERGSDLMVFAVTDDDISNYGGNQYDWGIFGYGRGDLKVCMVSSRRIGNHPDRWRDVVTHEMGHALGLPHCLHTGCIMQAFNGEARPGRTHFCPDCWSKVGSFMRWN